MKIILIKNGRLYSYILPKEVKDNFWITDIDSFDNVRNLINIEADNDSWVLTSNYDTHIMDTNNMHDRVKLNEYQFYTIKNDNEKVSGIVPCRLHDPYSCSMRRRKRQR